APVFRECSRRSAVARILIFARLCLRIYLGRMQSGSLRTARAFVFGLAFITLVAIAYLSNRAWTDYARSRAGIQAAPQATRVNERLLGWVRDAETGERGYLLTGRSEYLAPYHQSLDSIDEDL